MASAADLHRRFYAAFNQRDIDSLLALSAPGIAIESVFSAVGGARYQGHDGVRRWQADLAEAWGAEIRVEAETYFDLGDRALAFDVMYGRGRQSDATVALRGAAVTAWRDARCVYFKAYADRDEAVRDVGVAVGDLDRIRETG